MRYLLLMLILAASLCTLSVHASESKSESANPVHHTPHPPHDHPSHDHLKKLDEGMRNMRRKKETL